MSGFNNSPPGSKRPVFPPPPLHFNGQPVIPGVGNNFPGQQHQGFMNNRVPLPQPGGARHPFPGQHQHPMPPLPGQSHPSFANRHIPGQPPLPFHLQQQQQQQQFGHQNNSAAFHAMVHAQNMQNMQGNNMIPPRQSSSPISLPSTPPPQSPSTSGPPRRELPPPPTTNMPPSPRDLEQSRDRSMFSSSSSSSSSRGGSDESEKSSVRDLGDILNASVNNEESRIQQTLNKTAEAAFVGATTLLASETMVNTGVGVLKKVAGGDVMQSLEANPVLGQMIQLADKLVDIGKVVPFIAPAFVILKFIIDIEQKARDADAKCNDLLERINFMVSHVLVLEKIKVMDPVKVVVQKVQDCLKDAAALIQIYRKQSKIARRLNMGNSAKFVGMADRIHKCSQDLMLSLQIQQTGDLSLLTRAVPQDDEANRFVKENGGQDLINNNPDLVKKFAEKMHLTMSDQVMDQMTSNLEEMMDDNQNKIEAMLRENSSESIALTIKALATQAREFEAEKKMTCVQCSLEFRNSTNGPEACSFHKCEKDYDSYPCCGKDSPCQFRSHESQHHCRYPYPSFYSHAYRIFGYTDTVDYWSDIRENDMITDEAQVARVGKLLRWKSQSERVSSPLMLVSVGRVTHSTPYYFEVFTVDALAAESQKVSESGKTLIFRTSREHGAFSMAEWLVNNQGHIEGVQLTVKIDSCKVPTISVSRFDPKNFVLKAPVTYPSKVHFELYKPSQPYNLPETVHKGPVLQDTPLRDIREFKTKTTLPVLLLPESKMKANTTGRFMRFNADKFQGNLRVFNKSKPASQEHITLLSAKAEWRFVGEKDYKEVESFTLEGIVFPVTIAPMQTLDMPYEATVVRPPHLADLRMTCWYYALLATRKPFRLRVTFTDLNGETITLVQEYIHTPRGIQKRKPEEDLGYFFVDHVDRAERSLVRITKPSSSASSDVVVSINGSGLTVKDLNKIVYKAEKKGKISEATFGMGNEAGDMSWKVWALIDFGCRRVYGFKVLVTEGSNFETKTTACLGYAPCPLYFAEPGDEVKAETREVIYATEKIQFPELGLATDEEIVSDDQIDDDLPPPPPVVAVAVSTEETVAMLSVVKDVAPVISTTAATSISVASAVSSMATTVQGNMVDATAFTAGISTLEKRLESLDTNVARMATALEKLVLILST